MQLAVMITSALKLTSQVHTIRALVPQHLLLHVLELHR
jgi:hypothetical protein